MKKSVFILGAILVLALGLFILIPKLTGNSISSSQTISLAELSKHNSPSDCWVSYGNEVYDITSFLPNHPGKPEAIIPFCGTSDNFENAFNNKHGENNSYKIPKVGTFKGNLG
ncbi:MAG: cytochrome b5-like heme/steroid binding domain-containing protein [Nanoarchaeota archaeon]